jgi:hypothetical protein
VVSWFICDSDMPKIANSQVLFSGPAVTLMWAETRGPVMLAVFPPPPKFPLASDMLTLMSLLENVILRPPSPIRQSTRGALGNIFV